MSRLLLVVLACSSIASAAAASHRYKLHDPVPLYANKVGPFSNPS